ncbi:mediator of RNA polymerase II transcription subunit 18-like [Clavelina lepadiformis]|uniref:mediator of RNA polymerase II transcription subunit 18-like n=1 Tax=Clavelina lepadiformis TaxID=159417 RepID=UPI00404204FC
MNDASYHPLSADSASNVNLQEFFLQGSVLDGSIDKLFGRLQGICDNVKPEMFTDRERTYYLSTPGLTTSVMVKACKSIIQPSAPWQIKYIGNIEAADHTKPAMIRSNVTVAVSQDPSQFLEELGFILRYEVVLRGQFYRKGNLKVTVAKLLLNSGIAASTFDATKLEAANTSHLVEISALSLMRDDGVAEEVRRFAQLLAPIAMMEKVDHRRIQMHQ